MEIEEDSSINAADTMQTENGNNMFCPVGGDTDPLSPTNTNNANTHNISTSSSRGRSRVWNEFVVAADGKKVICRLCGDSLAYSNSHSTSSMLKHLKRRHNMDLYPPQEEESPSKVGNAAKSPEKPKKSNKVKRVTTITNSAEIEPEPSIQHGPLVFTENCIRMRWTDHSDAFLNTFTRLYTDECYTDVTLVAEKIFFKAHRVILSSASEFFDEMFRMTPGGQHPILFLKDVKAMELRILLDFIYKGEVAIPPSLITDLIRIGGEMKVRGLCDFHWNDSVKSSVLNMNPSVPNNTSRRMPHQPTNSVNSSPNTQPAATVSLIPPTAAGLSPEFNTITSSTDGAITNLVSTDQGTVKHPGLSPLSFIPKTVAPQDSLPQKSFSRILTRNRGSSNLLSPAAHPISTPSSVSPPNSTVPALKRIRILTSSAINKQVVPTRFDLAAAVQDTSYLSTAGGEAVLMMTEEGNAVLSTSQGDVTVVPRRTDILQTNMLESSQKIQQMEHSHHVDSHPITLVSHPIGTSSDLEEVVYSITSVTGPHCGVLMSEPCEDADTETIVMYGAEDALHQPCDGGDKKPLLQ